jgi:hypothetical protein
MHPYTDIFDERGFVFGYNAYTKEDLHLWNCKRETIHIISRNQEVELSKDGSIHVTCHKLRMGVILLLKVVVPLTNEHLIDVNLGLPLKETYL